MVCHYCEVWAREHIDNIREHMYMYTYIYTFLLCTYRVERYLLPSEPGLNNTIPLKALQWVVDHPGAADIEPNSVDLLFTNFGRAAKHRQRQLDQNIGSDRMLSKFSKACNSPYRLKLRLTTSEQFLTLHGKTPFAAMPGNYAPWRFFDAILKCPSNCEAGRPYELKLM